jgi:hypothetical protein
MYVHSYKKRTRNIRIVDIVVKKIGTQKSWQMNFATH